MDLTFRSVKRRHFLDTWVNFYSRTGGIRHTLLKIINILRRC